MGTGKKIWRTVYPLLIWFGSQFIVQYVYLFAVTFKYILGMGEEALNKMNDPAFIDTVLNHALDAVTENAILITFLCNALTIALLFIFYRLDKVKWDKGNCLNLPSTKKPLQYVLDGTLAISSCIGFNIVVSIIATIAVARFGEGIMDSYNVVTDSISAAPASLQFLTLVISAPICEELLMRGLIYKRFRSYMKPLAAAMISSAIFGLVHGNWVQFIYAFAIGVIAAYVYEYTRNLFAPMLFHIIANGISTLASTKTAGPYFNTMMFADGFVVFTLTVSITCIVTGILAMRYISKNEFSDQQ